MADADDSLELIDDEGNLFGVVNIIDALVVLLIAAVVVAGVALVVGGDEPPEPTPTGTTNVTLDLGTQPEFIASAINEGDTYSQGSNTQLTVTDVYAAPGGNQPRVTLRARVQAPLQGGSLSYADAPLRLGRALDIATERYQVSGRIRAVGQGDTLTREQTTVVVRDRISTAQARALAAGDEIRVAGRRVATVEDVAIFPTGNANERIAFVEADLETYRSGDTRRFGATPVREGQTLQLPTEAYTLSGRIERVGSGLDRQSMDVVVGTIVDTETADRIAVGDVATTAGAETATVETVDVYGTANPNRKRVFLGLSLNTVTLGQTPQFGTQPVQRGTQLSVETSSYQLTGRINRVGAVEQRGTPTTRTVTLRLNELREPYAEAIEPGLTERTGGESIARVTAVRTEPHPIIATGQNGSVNVVDHPFLRDVTITAELRVRETTSGLSFKGQLIRQRSTIVLDLGTVTIRAQVVSVGA